MEFEWVKHLGGRIRGLFRIHGLWIQTVGLRIIGSDLTIVLVRIPDVLSSRQHGVNRKRNIDHKQKNL